MHAKAKSSPEASSERAHSGARASTRPVRALKRGLNVLTELNRLESVAVNTLANAVGLPRTTTFRILETLRVAGYVERDPHDDCYRPTIMVRALSGGFDDEAMVVHIAKPYLTALGAQLAWPVAIATPAGAAMMMRETSDERGPPVVEQDGVRVPMLTCAAGRAYLAFCSVPQRDALLELMARSSLPEDRLARNRAEVDRLLHETRTQGFGMAQRTRRASEETSLALPLPVNDRILAALALRYPTAAVPLRSVIEQLLPKMREITAKIAREFAQKAGASAAI